LTNSVHILVIDDDPDLRRALTEVLEDEGYDVSCAQNGADALQALEGTAPSAILLDLTMPVMDGWTFRERQRSDAKLAAIPTVVISAAYSDSRQVSRLAPDAFLAKPFDVGVLTETLQRVCAPPGEPAPQPARGAAREPAPDAQEAETPPRR
jgi:two-component system, OmpR family, response regulator CpxR